MLIPQRPYFVIEGQDIAILRSMADLLGSLEPIDIDQEEYAICDSQGRRLYFFTLDIPGFFSGRKEVHFQAIDTEPSYAAQLAELLRERLRRAGVSADELCSVSLAQLVEKSAGKS